jgi:hypothetical protein
MKSSSFAIAAIVLLAANCLGAAPGAFGQQQGNADAKSCVNESAACTGQVAGSQATVAPAQAHPGALPAAAVEKFSFSILADLSGGLNVKKLKPGDRIKAQVSQDVVWHGKIIIPEDSRLVGHVTEVKRRSPDDPESRLGLVFDRVLLKHHQEIDLQGVVQALSPPAPRRSKVDEPDQMLPPSAFTPSQNTTGPIGGTSTGRGSMSSASNKTMSVATVPAGVPTYTAANPGSNPGNSVGGDLIHNQQSHQTPMSAGMPIGVFGIKGLTLSLGPTSGTPGPVILSNVTDVKLEDGTQVLLKVTDAKVRKP